MIGSQDMLIALVISVFLFGAKKLPELAGSLGKSMKEFRKAAGGAEEAETAEPPVPPRAVAPPAARSCGACKTALEAGWAHCPRCGAAVASEPASAPPA